MREVLPRATEEAVHRDYFVLDCSLPDPWPWPRAVTVADICRAAKRAARALAQLDTATKDAALHAIADALIARTGEILEANARDLEAGREAGLSRRAAGPARARRGADRRDRRGVRAVAALPDPVGEVVDGRRLPNGLDVRKVRVPLGVVARRLRGAAERHDRRGRAVPEVRQRDRAARLVVGGALQRRPGRRSPPRRPRRPGCPRAAIGARRRRRARGARRARHAGRRRRPDHPARRRGPEGGAAGGRHRAGDLRRLGQLPRLRRRDAPTSTTREAIVVNAKTQRPGVCNAAETLLVHADAAAAFLPRRAARRCATPASSCASTARTRALAGDAPATRCATRPTRTGTTEFLALVLAVGVVDSVDEAIEHVNRYGCGHSEAIVTARHARPRARSSAASTPRASTSTPRRASPTAASSAWAPRSATRPRSSTPAARSALRELCTYEVRGRGRRPRPPVSRGRASADPRRDVQPAAPRAPRLRAGGARPARARPRRCSCRSPRRRTRRSPDDPGAEAPAGAVPARGGRRRRASRCRARARPRRAVLHGRYPAGAACTRTGGRADLHRRAATWPRACRRWREPEAVLELATLAVAERAEPVRRTSSSGCAEPARRAASAWTSSTCRAWTSPRREIRRRVARGPADPLPRARRGRRATSRARPLPARGVARHGA